MSRRPEHGLTRRQFLPPAAAAAVAGAVVGYELPHGSGPHHRNGGTTTPPAGPANGATAPGPAQAFVTRPDLRPPQVTVANLAPGSVSASSPRHIVLAPMNVDRGTGLQQGLMMLDRGGRLVWFAPLTGATGFDLKVQSQRHTPRLTWWQGRVRSAHGYGIGVIADDAYHPVARIRAGHGLQADLHDLTLTSAGTALITAYETTRTDLSSVGGSRRGRTFTGHIQEIDLATGRVLLDWNSLDHVGIKESLVPLPGNHADAYDYFHVNSVGEMPDGSLLISARNTCALYNVDRATGRIRWRLGGRRSDFQLSAAARFYWQHDARAVGHSAITVFDNAGRKERRSRALLLSVDHRARRVDLAQAYLHPAGFTSNMLGSVQRLPDGRVFVGWGDQPYFSEFASDGRLLLDGRLPIGVRSYRAYAADWTGRPADAPRLVARPNPVGGSVVYVSWNGATEVSKWRILAGSDGESLEHVGTQRWEGLETVIAVTSTEPRFCAVALDARGRELGRSEVV